ncbi:EAL domain-containing protein [Bacillus sp. BGMRC 2118]|nr:EAL domain-containing protein [Bacillus sp. BGMRC 2118]
MIKTKKQALLTFLLTVILLYGWNLLFYKVEIINVLGSSLFPIIVGLLSFVWTYQTYRLKKRKEKLVWLLIGIGLLTHVTGNLIWFIGALLLGIQHAPDTSYLFWLLGITMFLFALIYKLQLTSTSISTNSHLFNTAIFFIVLFTVCVHFLVQPYIVTAANAMQVIVVGFLYPVVDISLLFVTTLLYILLRHSQDKTVMTFYMGAFYLQVVGDAVASIMKANQDYYQLLIEPIWVGSLLLVGFASIFARGNHQQYSEMNVSIYKKESIFPYISIFVFLVLVYDSYNWEVNALSIGLALVFFLIMGRHLWIIRKNRRLMMEYRILAYQDSLTGLLNRSSFKVNLENAIKQAENHNQVITLLLIDLDRFKMINDTLGHIVGDELLIRVASSLKNSLDQEHHIYRLGGDEFVVLLLDASKERSVTTANKIIESFNQTYLIKEHEVTITPSVGISSYPDNGRDSDTLFKAADAAMYLAKGKGRNNYHFYDYELNQLLSRRVQIEKELRKAIDKKELELFYQPKFNLQTREIVGMEALLRWNSRELGPVSPAEFIPIAEETGLIVRIGEWVLRTACEQNKAWQDQGYAPLCMSVNVSVQQFKHSNIMNTVEKVIDETGILPDYLELEITESIMQDIEESKKILNGLRKLGVQLSLDDFGTGYSSLHVLKNLPINTLKIDKTFVDDISLEDDQSLVKGIIDIAKKLRLQIVAEGIESKNQVEALAFYQCDIGQGYYFARPSSGADFEKLYLSRRFMNTLKNDKVLQGYSKFRSESPYE